MAVSDYDTTPGNNTTISGINIAEGCSPAGINDAIRQMMADIASWDADIPKVGEAESITGAWTLTSPTLKGAVLQDTNGKSVLLFAGTTTPVNNVKITNADAGGDPLIEPDGTDTNINLEIKGKGNGYVKLHDPKLYFGGSTGAEGDIYYRDSGAGGAGMARLAAGSDGEVLTLSGGVPAWASGSGLDFISSIDLSSQATAEFTGFDASRYDSYEFVLSNVIPATDGVQLEMQLSNDGGSTWLTTAATYEHAGNRNDTTLSIYLTADHFTLTGSRTNGNDASKGISGTVKLHGPHSTAYTTGEYETACTATNGTLFSAHGKLRFIGAAEAHDAARFLFSSGNLASGTITMFGKRGS